jgi:hypothetical protein
MPTPVHRLAVAARRHAADWRISFREFIPAQS